MAVRPILRMGHPTLREVAKPLPVTDFGSRALQDLIQDLVDTLADAGGIGLAAPQIGVSVRVAILQFRGGPTRYGLLEPMPLSVFVNPTITVLDPGTAGYWEGCLSVPGLRGFVERPQKIRVEARDADGEPIDLIGFETLASWSSRASCITCCPTCNGRPRKDRPLLQEQLIRRIFCFFPKAKANAAQVCHQTGAILSAAFKPDENPPPGSAMIAVMEQGDIPVTAEPR